MAQRLNKKLVAGLTIGIMLLMTAAAIVMIRHLPQRDPGPAAKKADAYAAAAEYRQAREWYARAYRLSLDGTKATPDSNKYMIRVGDMCVAMGDARAALGSWRQVMTNDPSNEAAQRKIVDFLLGIARDMRMVRWSDVQGEAEKLLAINPRDPVGMNALGMALIMQKNVDAEYTTKGEEYLREAFNADKSNADFANSLAMHYMEENQGDKAVATFEQLMANLPEDEEGQAKAWRLRGRFYLVRRVGSQQELARKENERAAPGELEQLKQDIAKWDGEATKSLNEAIRISPQSADNLIAMGEYWLTKAPLVGDEKQKQAEYQTSLAKAEEFLRQAIEADKDGYDAYLRLAQLYINSRKFDEALQVLSERRNRGVQREGFMAARNKDYMTLIRNEMFRVLMVKAELEAPLSTAPGAEAASTQPASSQIQSIVAQMQQLRDEQAADRTKEDPAVLFMDGRMKILENDLIGAVKDLEAADKRAQNNPEILQYLAQLYMRMGEFGSSIEALRTVLASYPNNPKAWALQAMLLLQTGQADAALQAAERAYQLDPNSREAIAVMGRVYEQRKNWEKAREMADRIAQLNGSEARNKLQQAAILVAQAQSAEEPEPQTIAEAEKMLREVLLTSPGDTTALQQLVLLARDPKNPGQLDPVKAAEVQTILKEQEAIVRQQLERASASQPAGQDAQQAQQLLDTIAWLQMMVDPTASKEEQAQRAEEIIKRGKDPFVVATQLYQLYAVQPEKSKEAMEQLRKAYTLRPNAPGIIEALFIRALRDKDWAAADQYVQKAAELNIDRTGGHFYRGRLLAIRTDGAGGVDKAIQAFRAGLNEFPTYSQGHVLLGRALAQQKDYEGATQAFREAYRLNPANGAAALGLATVASLRHDEAQKTQYLRICERLIPNHPWVRAELQALEDKRDPKQGIARREEMRKADPRNVDNLLRLAALYEIDKQPDAAQAAYEECRKVAPSQVIVVQRYAEFLRRKSPPELEAATKMLREFVDSIDPKDGLTKATGQLVLAAHLEGMSQMNVPNPPTSQAIDDAYVAAAGLSDHSAVRLDIGEYYQNKGLFTEAEKWYREALSRAETEGFTDGERNARENIIRAIIRSRDPKREEDIRKEIATYRQKFDDAFALMAESEYYANAGKFEESMAAINQFVDRRPDSASGHFQRANILFLRSLWQPALDDYRKAKALDPQGFNYAHRIRLALCLERLGQADMAAAELLGIVTERPDQTDATDELLRLYAKLAQWDNAEKLLQDRRKEFPADLQWLERLSSLYQASGQEDKAVRTGMELVLQSQYSRPSVASLIQTYLQFKRYDELLRFVDAQVPKDVRSGPYFDLVTAEAYAGKGDQANAVQYYNKVLDATVADIGRFASTVDDIRKLLGPQAAMEVVRQRLARNSDERPARFVLGVLQEQTGEKGAQIKAIKGLLETLPADDKPEHQAEKLYLLQALALDYYNRKDHAEARQTYEEMLKINPNSIVALNNLAYLLMEHIKDPNLALPYSRRAANLLPFDANVLDTVGWNHILLGNYDLGISALRRAIGINDNLAAVHYHAAEAFHRRANSNPASKDADLREAENEIRRAYRLIQAPGADTEGLADEILALSEKLGVNLGTTQPAR